MPAPIVAVPCPACAELERVANLRVDLGTLAAINAPELHVQLAEQCTCGACTPAFRVELARFAAAASQ